jgi:hypothetical protein
LSWEILGIAHLDLKDAISEPIAASPAGFRRAVVLCGSGYAIAVYILVCAVLSLISAALRPDYTNRDISAAYDTG